MTGSASESNNTNKAILQFLEKLYKTVDTIPANLEAGASVKQEVLRYLRYEQRMLASGGK